MARGVNKVILIGGVGKDPVKAVLPSGVTVTEFSLATTESWKDKATGQKKEETEWHSIKLFGKVAEIAAEYVRKGSSVYVEGKIKTRKWDKDGVTHYKTEVVADQLQLLGGSADKQESRKEEPQPEPMAFDDDIPF